MELIDQTTVLTGVGFCPPALREHIIKGHPETGKKWLADLPALLKSAEKIWQLSLGACFPDASFNFVAPVTRADGSQAVLKCGLPTLALCNEIAALRHFNGQGAVKLLQADEEQGLFLLDKVEPGTLLETHTDPDYATRLAVELMQRLHKPLNTPGSFQTLADLFKGFDDLYQRFDGKTGPFPSVLIDHAQGISRELLDSQSAPVLLHGDLHYANILLSKANGAIAIDPKGFIGEPEYETPLPRLTPELTKKVLRRRLDVLIEMSGFDRERIIAWLFAKATLAAWWSFEDTGEISLPFLECAERVLEIGI